MGILFIISIFLAWPTYGISLILWGGIAILPTIINENEKFRKIKRREKVVEIIEPLFSNRFVDFFCSLDIPIYNGVNLTEEEAYQCGRYIMNYIAHNPSETLLFIQGLQNWTAKSDINLCDPVTAARNENYLDEKGKIHIVAYEAVEALMTNNNLLCFKKVNFSELIQKKLLLSLKNVS